MPAAVDRFRTVRGARVLVGAVALVIAGALSSTAAGQAGDPLTVAPTEGSQFTAVTVSGGNCRAGTPAVLGALLGPPGTGSTIEGTPFRTAVTGTVFSATPDAGGSWAAQFTVPPFVDAGDYEVAAVCKDDPNAPTGPEYQRRPFRMLAATPPTMSVAPRSGRAGQELPLAVSGRLCQGPSAQVDVGVFQRVPEAVGAADEFTARATLVPDGAGAWSGSVTLPATAVAGTYGVAATCRMGSQALFTYLPVPEVVLTAAATPVPARPRFTG